MDPYEQLAIIVLETVFLRRKGFDWWWDDIGGENQGEVIAELASFLQSIDET
jgi:hypothetical protein